MHQFCTAGYFAVAQYDRCIFVTGLPRRAILALLAMTAYFFASEISYRPRNKRAYTFYSWSLILLHGFKSFTSFC
ncbi:MAG: hypothetical protein K6C94_05595 [Candidatus Gastranaerophilales bacterium]|nr:hypothetical protein [Candidatus Gastranaerophilales bacterium]